MWIERGEPTYSGIATPGHTRACAHVNFTGAWVNIMQKANQLSASRSQVLYGHEVSIQVRLKALYLWWIKASEVI